MPARLIWATGLLVIMLGNATKLADRPMAEDKIYKVYSVRWPLTQMAMGSGQERDYSAVTRRCRARHGRPDRRPDAFRRFRR